VTGQDWGASNLRGPSQYQFGHFSDTQERLAALESYIVSVSVAMSGLDQSRRFGRVPTTSAPPLYTDIATVRRDLAMAGSARPKQKRGKCQTRQTKPEPLSV